jgi:short-subunit dehydrogenase
VDEKESLPGELMKTFNRAMITGASRGLGQEIVKALVNRTENLVLVARDEKALLAFKDKLQKEYKYKGEIDIVLADFTEKSVLEKVSAYQKPIDLLINNAGLGFVNRFEKMSSKEIDQMIMVNNYALTMLTHHFYNQMINNKKGQIINIASVAGFGPIPLFSVYGATKSYVISFSRALDAESKKSGVRVKTFCPGGIKTQFHITAGMGEKIAEDNRHFMETPERTAQDIMKLIDSECDKYTPRYYNKLVGVLARFLPSSFMIKQSKSMYEKYLPR